MFSLRKLLNHLVGSDILNTKFFIFLHYFAQYLCIQKFTGLSQKGNQSEIKKHLICAKYFAKFRWNRGLIYYDVSELTFTCSKSATETLG